MAVTSLASTQLADQAETAAEDAPRHGYPPPVRPVGSTVVAYCGALMVVQGESLTRPPGDTCPDCAQIWRERKRRGRRFGHAPRH